MFAVMVRLPIGAGLVSCQRGNSEPAVATRTAPVVDTGSLQGDPFGEQIAFEFVIYYLPEPVGDPLADVDRLLKEAWMARTEAMVGTEASPTVQLTVIRDPGEAYSPPDEELLQTFGRGLSREQARDLQSTRCALSLRFAWACEQPAERLRRAMTLTQAIAEQSEGLIWDDETRQMFSPDRWKGRLEGWEGEIPDVSRQMTIHAYQSGELMRAVTLGMAKLGLPDLVVEEFPWSLNGSVGNSINLVAQAFMEGQQVGPSGTFDLDLRSIRHRRLREEQLEKLEENGTGVALLGLKPGTPDKGDPDNRLWQLTFERGEGPDPHARMEHVLIEAFGGEDSVVSVKHDDELVEASRRARELLPRLKRAFNAGLTPGEILLLKWPFKTPDEGHEYMWVEVTKWGDDSIEGLLANEPFQIPTLKAGQKVVIQQEKVFDFIWHRADGSTEGNETGKILKKRQE
jgi:uncharacterized protein YegJ (DUF2314 family)